MSWDGLVAAALLGTERRRPQPNGDAMLAGIDWDDPEGALLAAAAVLSTARAAGARPPALDAPAPAPEEEQPLCSREADAVLARVVAEQPDLLEEWLERAGGHGLLAWPRRLPALLSEATHDRHLRGLVLRVGGRRLTWLAPQLPDWGWATKDPADLEAWQTGTREERLAMLRAVRAQDPAAARGLLESTWDADSSDDRRVFLQALETGLSSADEPLLERALDGRRAITRRHAADLLRRLPDSAYGARMAARLAPLISVTGTVRQRLEVEPPEAFDESMARDGLRDTRGPKDTGPRGWWLRQIVRAAPLRVWTERLGLAPARIVELLRRDEPDLLHEVTLAAADQRDAEWAAAIAEQTGELIPGLPRTAVRELVRRARDLKDVFAIADRAAGPWDAETSHAFLDAIERAKPEQARSWLRREDLHPFADRLGVGGDGILERAAAVLAPHDGMTISPDAVGEALAVLDLRHAIMRELP